MDDSFNPIRTTRKVQANIEKFETLSLRDPAGSQPPSTKSKISIIDLSVEDGAVPEEPFSLRPSVRSSSTTVTPQSNQKRHKRHDSIAFLQKSYLQDSTSTSFPEDARAILKSQPDPEDLLAVLQYLQYGIEGKHDFNVRIPDPKSSAIVHIIVTATIPDQWPPVRGINLHKSQAKLKKLIINALSSVSGIGALLMQAKRLSTSPNQHNELLQDVLSILAAILSEKQILGRFLNDAHHFFTSETPRRVFWQEVVALFAGSKIFSALSHIFSTVHGLNDQLKEHTWLGTGLEYSQWLSRSISAAAVDLFASTDQNNESINRLGQLFKRGLSLGYRDAFAGELYRSLLFGKRALWTPLHTLLKTLSAHDQRSVYDIILRDVARNHLQLSNKVLPHESPPVHRSEAISGVAAMISGLTTNNKILEAHAIDWLTSTSADYAGFGLETRRAIIATLAEDQGKLQHILEASLASFGNKLQIHHAAMLQQESTAQTTLLTLGYLDRLDHEYVKRISGSGVFLQMVSNRLSASVPRARFLGMIVATALSKLVEKPDKVMNFGVEDMESDEAHGWLDLVNIVDTVGNIEAPIAASAKDGGANKRRVQTAPKRPSKNTTPPNTALQNTKIIAIEEVSDSDEVDTASGEEDPQLRPYIRPDSDPEDSDDDPTLINRNKPSAPVYIISLIKQLNMSDDLAVTELALKTAPSLIRRKAAFGDELGTNLLPLAASLLNLRDGVSEHEMQRLRTEALIACLVSMPGKMGSWLSSMYFEGDFSLSQRAALLTTIGLGSRELAGYDDGIVQHADAASTMFPSNRLPQKLDSHYLSLSSPISSISGDISHRTLKPMALKAADKLTGPDILKIRTFSSRMEVERKTAAKAEARSKRIPKDLHKVLAESIYLPFCSRLTLVLSSLSTSAYLANSTLMHTSLLKLCLQTLTIVLSTLGPHALQLPIVTRETLLLLTRVHTLPTLAHDPMILPTILQLLLAVLDLNINAGTSAEERLVTDFGPLLAELISWAGDLGERVNIPEVDAHEGGEMPWPVLVAGIQVKWHEVGKKFQGRMLGLMAGTDFDTF